MYPRRTIRQRYPTLVGCVSLPNSATLQGSRVTRLITLCSVGAWLRGRWPVLLMKLGSRKSEVILLFLYLCLARPAIGLQPSRAAGMTLNPSSGRVVVATSGEVMCDPRGDISLEAAQTGRYLPLATESPTSSKCLG